MKSPADLPKLKPSRPKGDFYDIAATTAPMLHEWISNRVYHDRLMQGIRHICKEKGLDPETATVRQFMELEGQ